MDEPFPKIEQNQAEAPALPELSPASEAVREQHTPVVALLINFFRRLGTLLFTAVKEFLNDECPNLAAQISYFALFSVFPLILVIVIIVSFLLPSDQIAQENIIRQLTRNFPSNTIKIDEIVRGAIQQVTNSQPLFIVFSVVSLIWAGSGIFDSITISLNKAWQTPGTKPRSFFESLFLRFALMVILGAMFFGSIAITFAYNATRDFATTNRQLGIYLKNNPIWDILSFLIPWTLNFATFMIIYRVVPQRKVNWKDVWPGAILATILFELIKLGFSFYISSFTNFNLTYGSITGVIVFIFWLYLIAIILLMGGEVSSVWAEMRGNKHPGKLARQGKVDEAPANSPPPATSIEANEAQAIETQTNAESDKITNS